MDDSSNHIDDSNDDNDSCLVYGIAYNNVINDNIDDNDVSADSVRTKHRILQSETKKIIGKKSLSNGFGSLTLNGQDGQNDNEDIENDFSFTEEERKQIYHDPAVRLRKDDLTKSDVKGKPLCDSHGEQIGIIIDAELKDNELFIVGKTWDKDIAKKIRSGQYGSFSIGYDFKVQNKNGLGVVTGKPIIHEVSVCEEPFFEDCTIQVVANKGKVKQTIISFARKRKLTNKEKNKIVINNFVGRLKKKFVKKEENIIDPITSTTITTKKGKNEIKISEYKDKFKSKSIDKGSKELNLSTSQSLPPTKSEQQPATTNNNMTTPQQQQPPQQQQQQQQMPPQQQQQQQQHPAQTGGTSADMMKLMETVKQLQEQNQSLAQQNEGYKMTDEQRSKAYIEKQKPKLDNMKSIFAEISGVGNPEHLPPTVSTILNACFNDIDASEFSESMVKLTSALTGQNDALTKHTETIKMLNEKVAQYEQNAATGSPQIAQLGNVFTPQQQQQQQQQQQFPPAMNTGGELPMNPQKNFFGGGNLKRPFSAFNGQTSTVGVTASKSQRIGNMTSPSPVINSTPSWQEKFTSNSKFQTRSGAEHSPLIGHLMSFRTPGVHENPNAHCPRITELISQGHHSQKRSIV